MTSTDEGDRQAPKLYRELAEWYPLLTPVAGFTASVTRAESATEDEAGHDIFVGLRPG